MDLLCLLLPAEWEALAPWELDTKKTLILKWKGADFPQASAPTCAEGAEMPGVLGTSVPSLSWHIPALTSAVPPSPPPGPFTAASTCSPKMPQNKWQQHPQCTFFHCPVRVTQKTTKTRQTPLKINAQQLALNKALGISAVVSTLLFSLGTLDGKLLHSFHPQHLLYFPPSVIFSQPIRFPERTHHSWQGNARAALPAWPCQGGKWFPHRAMFSNRSELLTRNKSQRLIFTGH